MGLLEVARAGQAVRSGFRVTAAVTVAHRVGVTRGVLDHEVDDPLKSVGIITAEDVCKDCARAMRWTVRRAAPSGSGGANAPILGMHGSLSILPWHAFSFAVPVQAGTVETMSSQLLPPQPAPPKLL